MSDDVTARRAAVRQNEIKIASLEATLVHIAEAVDRVGKRIDQIPELRTQIQILQQIVRELQHLVNGNGREGYVEFRVQVNDTLETLLDDYQNRQREKRAQVREDRKFRRQIRWTIGVQFAMVLLAWVLALWGAA